MQALFRKIDADSNGQIRFSEFCKVVVKRAKKGPEKAIKTGSRPDVSRAAQLALDKSPRLDPGPERPGRTDGMPAISVLPRAEVEEGGPAEQRLKNSAEVVAMVRETKPTNIIGMLVLPPPATVTPEPLQLSERDAPPRKRLDPVTALYGPAAAGKQDPISSLYGAIGAEFSHSPKASLAAQKVRVLSFSGLERSASGSTCNEVGERALTEDAVPSSAAAEALQQRLSADRAKQQLKKLVQQHSGRGEVLAPKREVHRRVTEKPRTRSGDRQPRKPASPSSTTTPRSRPKPRPATGSLSPRAGGQELDEAAAPVVTSYSRLWGSALAKTKIVVAMKSSTESGEIQTDLVAVTEPIDKNVVAAIATLHNENGQPRPAATLTYATKALCKNPQCFPALQCRAAANCMLSNLTEAIADAERGLYLFPNDVHCWLWKSTAHFHLKEYAEAAAGFRRGLQYEPTHARLQRGYYASQGWLKKTGQ